MFESGDFSSNKLSGTLPGNLAQMISRLNFADNLIESLDNLLCNSHVEDSVKQFGCDAILCAPGKYNPTGHQTSPKNACMSCSNAEYYGTSTCLDATGFPDVDVKDDDDYDYSIILGNVTDRDILESFYYACDGYHWWNNDNWISGTTICDWEGITCVAGKGETVESINLGSNNLVGTPPAALFSLPNLLSLSLYSNPMGFSFSGIANAKLLTHIYLDATKIDSLTGIGDAPSLVVLNVRFNNLSGPIPDELTNLKHLRYLAISNNNFKGSFPLGMANLESLEDLSMSNNQIKASLVGVQFPISLRSIDISNNELSGVIPDSFLLETPIDAKLSIDLSRNELQGIVPANLARFNSLELYLKDNFFDGLPKALCEKKEWNNGDVLRSGCDGILCPKGTSSQPKGRATDGGTCSRCSTAFYLGQSDCFSATADARSIAVTQKPVLSFTCHIFLLCVLHMPFLLSF
mmetsp:Transcript_35350/g.40922  ORF Transcript_35350/g.40922 Transcript_35350/m.40922 type:complete len:463 (-) Transcript_35350:79-1467(-)